MPAVAYGSYYTSAIFLAALLCPAAAQPVDPAVGITFQGGNSIDVSALSLSPDESVPAPIDVVDSGTLTDVGNTAAFFTGPLSGTGVLTFSTGTSSFTEYSGSSGTGLIQNIPFGLSLNSSTVYFPVPGSVLAGSLSVTGTCELDGNITFTSNQITGSAGSTLLFDDGLPDSGVFIFSGSGFNFASNIDPLAYQTDTPVPNLVFTNTTGTQAFSGAIADNLYRVGLGGTTTFTGPLYQNLTIQGGTAVLAGANGNLVSEPNRSVLLEGGTLVLDNTAANNNNRISQGLGFDGGVLRLLGAPNGTTNEYNNFPAGTNQPTGPVFNSGQNVIQVQAGIGTASYASYTFGGLPSTYAGSADFEGLGANAQVFFDGMAEGPMYPWMTFGGTDFATYDTTTGVGQLPAAGRPSQINGAASNAYVLATGAQTALTQNETLYGVTANGEADINLGSSTLQLSAWIQNAGCSSIISGGTLSGNPDSKSNFGSLIVTANGNLTLNNTLLSTSVLKNGSGTLTLSGSLFGTYNDGVGYSTATLYVNQGALVLDMTSPIYNSQNYYGYPTIIVGGGPVGTSTLSLAADGQFYTSPNASITVGIQVLQSGRFLLNGHNAALQYLEVDGGSVDTGGATITAGNLVAVSPDPTGTISNGTVTLTGSAPSITVSSPYTSYNYQAPHDGLVINSAVTSTTTLTKTGNGVLALTNPANTFGSGTLGLLVEGGTVAVSCSGALGTQPIQIGGVFEEATMGCLRADSTGTLTVTNPVSIGGSGFGGSPILLAGGVMQIAAGEMMVNNVTTVANYTNNLPATSGATWDGKTGTGTLVFTGTGTGTTTGFFELDRGGLAFDTDSPLPPAMTLPVVQGTLEAVNASHTVSNRLIIEGDIVFTGSHALTFSAATGNTTGPANVVDATRVLYLDNTAPVTINNFNSGQTYIQTIGSGTLSFSGTSQLTALYGSGAVQAANSSALTISQGTFSGVLGGPGQIIKATGGVLTLSNASNAITGSVNISSGTVIATSLGSGAVQVSSQLTMTNNSALGAVTVGTSGSLVLSFNGVMTVTSLIIGNGVSVAPGTYTVAQLNSYGGHSFTNFSNGAGFSGTLQVVNNAITPVTVNLANLSQVYNGSPEGVTVTTNPPNLNYTLTYNGSLTVPTAAGSYNVLATITSPGYAGSGAGTLVIQRQPATVTLANATYTYDGQIHTTTLSTAPPGLSTHTTYNGTTAGPVNAGTYNVVTSIIDPNYTGSATATIVIQPAPVMLVLGNLVTGYTGLPQPVSVTTTPPGVSTTVTYNGNATAPTAIGSYAVAATSADPNYTGSATGTLVIGKGAVTITLGNLAVTYNGFAHSATATTAPSGVPVTLTYNGGTRAPSAVGSYVVDATVANANFTGSATGTLVISPGVATVTVPNETVTYNGRAHVATATTIPVLLPVTLTYNGSAQAPTATGTYTVVGTVATADYTGSSTGTLVISPIKPLATTLPAGAMTSATATLNGSSNPEGADTTVSFQYGTSTAYGLTTTGVDAGVGSVVALERAGITGLTPHTLYHFRVVATNAGGTAYGADRTFTTLVVPTLAANGQAYLSASGAQLSFSVNPNGLATSVYFLYGTDSANLNLQTATKSIGAGKIAVNVSTFLSGLAPGTTYYYQVVVVSAAGTFTSSVQTFTTLGFDTTLVAETGTLAPGTAYNWATLGNAAVNGADGAAFRATLTGPAATANTGIWANLANSGTLSLVAQTGAASPDANGNATAALYSVLMAPVYNNSGDVAFGATLKVATGSVTAATENGIWASNSGTLSLLAREGSAAPGTNGNFSAFSAVGLSDGNGAIISAILATSATATITAANNAGVWEGPTSNDLTLMLRTGERTDTSKTIASFKLLPAETFVNGQTRGFGPATGDLTALATYTDKTTGIIKVVTPGSPLVVATLGDTAAGTGSATFATFSNPAINDSDHVAFEASLKGGDTTTKNAAGVWADDSSGTRQLIARLAQLAPGTTAAFTAFNDPVDNVNDVVAFRATLSIGTGAATAASDIGIWRSNVGSLTLVARTGQQAPGCPAGVTLATITGMALDNINGADQQGGVIFLATLAGTGVTAANNTAIFAQDNIGALQLIVCTGDVLNNKTVTALSFLPAEAIGNGSVSGQGRSFSPATGDLIFDATFGDKSQAIFNVVFP